MRSFQKEIKKMLKNFRNLFCNVPLRWNKFLLPEPQIKVYFSDLPVLKMFTFRLLATNQSVLARFNWQRFMISMATFFSSMNTLKWMEIMNSIGSHHFIFLPVTYSHSFKIFLQCHTTWNFCKNSSITQN